MLSQAKLIVLCLASLFTVGCGDFDRTEPPHMFLGVPENETSGEGPVGLINGESIRVHDVSEVQEVPYNNYLEAKKASRIVAEESHNGFVYWAVKEDRDVRYENATAWIAVLERYRSKSK